MKTKIEVTYLIQVSDHPRLSSPPTQDEGQSWRTVYDGPIESALEAHRVIDALSRWYRHVRAFRGKGIGRLWREVHGH